MKTEEQTALIEESCTNIIKVMIANKIEIPNPDDIESIYDLERCHNMTHGSATVFQGIMILCMEYKIDIHKLIINAAGI